MHQSQTQLEAPLVLSGIITALGKHIFLLLKSEAY